MKARFLVALVALQSIWVLATAVRQEALRWTGRIIRVETRPVDPRDLLRGDYVTLGYDMNSLPLDKIARPPAPGQWKAGTPVFVELEPDGSLYRPVRGCLQAPMSVPEGHVVIAGRLGTVIEPTPGSSGNIPILYGIERFHVREGTGNPHGSLTAEIAVGRTGVPSLRELYIDNVPYAEAMRSAAR